MLKAPPIQKHEPTWDIAQLFPLQGTWSEEEYLALDTNRLTEFTNGFLEVLPMPSLTHQHIVGYLYRMLFAFVALHNLGNVFFAPTRVRVTKKKFREPDVVFVAAEHAHWQSEQNISGADLVIEVISPDDPERDTVRKRVEYGNAGSPEYWLVDPRTNQITVLTLPTNATKYAEHAIFSQGETATSVLLDGFTVPVTAVFAAAK
jgi:Uma2 family endonuclease